MIFSILFACIGNSARSQMAEGWARKLADFPIEIQSAGTKPAKNVASLAIQVMKEAGIDISNYQPKMLTTKMVSAATHFISMGCGVEDSCPVPIAQVKVENWELDDPKGKDIVFFRQLRDIIHTKVEDLLARLKTTK